MKPGELRRFDEGLLGGPTVECLAGSTILILEVGEEQECVTFLIGDRIEHRWGYSWMVNATEVISEG